MKSKKNHIILFAILMTLLLISPTFAQETTTSTPLTPSLEIFGIDDHELLLTLTLELEKDWYTYANDPGGMGKPTLITGQTASEHPITVFFPKPIVKPDSYDHQTLVNTYKNGTRIFISIPKHTPIFPIKLQLDMLLCHPTRCIPLRRNLIFRQENSSQIQFPQAQKQTWWSEFNSLKKKHSPLQNTKKIRSQKAHSLNTQWHFTPQYIQPGVAIEGLLSAALMGILAGLILNIMPCVLPVVSLKLSAILHSSVTQDEEIRIQQFREHNIFFSLGVLTFFLVLAILLGATGQAWGALFQYKWLVLSIAGIVLTLSLSLFGLFHLPVIDLKFGEESNNPKIKAFFTGNLTTLLATPCSGPFLGGVLSWALVQGPMVIATVFICIGIGMATPYLILAINPRLARFLPKAGPWIEYVEKGIAFFLIGTSFYLVSIVFGDASQRILALLWVLLFGGWLISKTKKISPLKKWGVLLFCLLLSGWTFIWTAPDKVENSWTHFDATTLHKQLGEKTLFLDFTADWCPTCKLMEATVLSSENIQVWKERYNIEFIKVDMTQTNPESEALLKALGSISIPTAALIPSGHASRSPIVLRDLYTKTQLEHVLETWSK